MPRHKKEKKKKAADFEFEGDSPRDSNDADWEPIKVAEPPIRGGLARRTRETTDDPTYLDSVEEEQARVILPVAVPDVARCQFEWLDTAAETFGPRPLVRCEAAPSVLAFQKRSRDADEPTGVVSLCDVHKALVQHMFPKQCYFRTLTDEKRVGDYC